MTGSESIVNCLFILFGGGVKVLSRICALYVIHCSKHLWQWNLLTGEEQGPAERPLVFYESEIRDGDVWAKVDQELVYEFEEEDDDDFEW